MSNGYEILRGLGIAHYAEAVLREMYLDFAKHGLSHREINCWNKDACWFPDLREHETVTALRDALPAELKTGVPCEPQLLWHLPSVFSGEPWPHIDQEPPWANGRKYIRIVGVALSDWKRENGAPVLWSSVDEKITACLNRGDVLVMEPHVPHTRGINQSGEVRAAAYFRFLEGRP